MSFNLTIKVRHVSDATYAWATKETMYGQGGRSASMFMFYFNPSVPMTLEDVATTLENERSIGNIRIGRIRVRGHDLARQDLANYNAADLMKDDETFTCALLPVCCTVL